MNKFKGENKMKLTLKEIVEQGRIDELVAKAESGDANAQVMVGDLYFFPFRGIENMDCDIARQWYQKATDQNYPRGIERLAFVYELGYGKDGKIIFHSDKEKARELYEKAAAIGSVSAKERLEKIMAREAQSNIDEKGE